jgi:hypothetical protein
LRGVIIARNPAQLGHIIRVPAVETIVQPHFFAAAATPFM